MGLADLIDAAMHAAPDGFEERPPEWAPHDHGDGWLPRGAKIERVEHPALVYFDDAPGGEPDPGLGQEVRYAGLDRLAWYRSYHFGEGQWGIYIRGAGVDHVAAETGAGRGVAYGLLLEHERFHFLADVAATLLEVESGSPAYLPHRQRAWRRRDDLHLGWCSVAEGAANGRALDSVPRGARRAASEWMRSRQPEGYRDVDDFVTGGARSPRRDLKRNAGMQEIVGHLAGNAGHPRSLAASGQGHLVFDLAELLIDEVEVPVHFIHDSRAPLVVRVIQAATVDDRPGRIPRELEAQWDKAKAQLAVDSQHPSLRLKQLKGREDMWSARVGRGNRALMRRTSGSTFVLEKIEKRSDVYR